MMHVLSVFLAFFSRKVKRDDFYFSRSSHAVPSFSPDATHKTNILFPSGILSTIFDQSGLMIMVNDHYIIHINHDHSPYNR